MKELIKAEEEKTLFIGRHGNECIYVVRAVSREAAMHLLNEVTGFEGDAWDLDVADNENGKIIEQGEDFMFYANSLKNYKQICLICLIKSLLNVEVCCQNGLIGV